MTRQPVLELEDDIVNHIIHLIHQYTAYLLTKLTNYQTIKVLKYRNIQSYFETKTFDTQICRLRRRTVY